ncbi:MAG: EamA family transporter [Anaerolineae bacterium]|nr:EamA family transporter [Anaerolineae bacterium]
MFNGTEFGAVIFGLASAATWGVGDFSGGLATRRVSVLTVTLLSQVAGLILLVLLALIWGEKLPSLADVGWGSLAGIFGLFGLMALYRAMAIGQMGIAAPVAAVLSASLPVAVGAMTQGVPELPRLTGFVLAVVGIWFISRPQNLQGRPAALGLAIVAGLCFGGFLLGIAQVEQNAVFWPLVAARTASIMAMLLVVGAGQKLALCLGRTSGPPGRSRGIGLALSGDDGHAGPLDTEREIGVVAGYRGAADLAGRAPDCQLKK